VFSASLVSQFGDGVINVALAFAVLDLTGSASDLGIVIAARTVAQVSALLFGGVVADRAPRRAVMMCADITRLCAQVAIGVLLVSGDATVVEVALSQALVGAASGFFNPAAGGLLPAVAGDYLQQANALQGIAGAGSGIVGPAIGGVLVVAVGAPWALIVDGATYLLSALLLSRVSRSVAASSAANGERTSFIADLKSGFKEVSSRTWVWALILTFGIGNALVGTFEVLGPLICKRHYGGAAAFALLNVLWALGALLGGSALMRFKPRHPLRAGVLMCIAFPLPGILLALHVPLYAIVPIQLLAGIGPIGFNTLWWTTLQQKVPQEAISRVISYDMAGSYALQPIGYLLAGPLAIAVGLSAAIDHLRGRGAGGHPFFAAGPRCARASGRGFGGDHAQLTVALRRLSV
jgi:MFS family permease